MSGDDDDDDDDDVEANIAAAADVVVCFKVFDCDRDGLLSVAELHHMLAAMLVVHQLNQSTTTAHSMV